MLTAVANALITFACTREDVEIGELGLVIGAPRSPVVLARLKASVENSTEMRVGSHEDIICTGIHKLCSKNLLDYLEAPMFNKGD